MRPPRSARRSCGSCISGYVLRRRSISEYRRERSALSAPGIGLDRDPHRWRRVSGDGTAPPARFLAVGDGQSGVGRVGGQGGAARGHRGDRHYPGRAGQSAMDPGVRDHAVFREGVRTGHHAQSGTCVLVAAAGAGAGDLVGARGISLAAGRGGRGSGVVEHQPRRHRIAASVTAMSVALVYVHGLWLGGGEAWWLRRRLARDLEAQESAFSYPSIAADVTTNAAALGAFLGATRADTLHLVGHSLGGLVILKLFEQGAGPDLPPGRIVLLGPPLRGSRAARNLARLPFGKKILGRGIQEEALAVRDRCWSRRRELGVIAGDLGLGAGQLFGKLGAPSDGTVTVEETQIEGAADR